MDDRSYIFDTHEAGCWHDTQRAYAWERSLYGHILSLLQVPHAGLFLMMIDGVPAGFTYGGLADTEHFLEEKVKRMELAHMPPPWSGEERRHKQRSRTQSA